EPGASLNSLPSRQVLASIGHRPPRLQTVLACAPEGTMESHEVPPPHGTVPARSLRVCEDLSEMTGRPPSRALATLSPRPWGIQATNGRITNPGWPHATHLTAAGGYPDAQNKQLHSSAVGDLAGRDGWMWFR